jgi:hypothetical protein
MPIFIKDPGQRRSNVGLHDPVAVYNAANNAEAMILREALLASGIEAHSVDDATPVGAWMFGLLPEIHKPQVWVDRADVPRAVHVIENFEARAAQRRQTNAGGVIINVVCEECGKASEFPASRLGSVEVCPHCGAFVDVGDDVGFDDWKAFDEPPST